MLFFCFSCCRLLLRHLHECGEDSDDDEGDDDYTTPLHQYDVATMSRVGIMPLAHYGSFAISPCSRVVVFGYEATGGIATRQLYPHNSVNKIKQ